MRQASEPPAVRTETGPAATGATSGKAAQDPAPAGKNPYRAAYRSTFADLAPNTTGSNYQFYNQPTHTMKQVPVPTFKDKLYRWVAAGAVDERADRREAAALILEAFASEKTKLFLANRNLSSLPECLSELKSLEILDLSKNQLTKLPALPTSLTGLNVSANRLTHLPALPASLKYLLANHNPQLPLESVERIQQRLARHKRDAIVASIARSTPSTTTNTLLKHDGPTQPHPSISPSQAEKLLQLLSILEQLPALEQPPGEGAAAVPQRKRSTPRTRSKSSAPIKKSGNIQDQKKPVVQDLAAVAGDILPAAAEQRLAQLENQNTQLQLQIDALMERQSALERKSNYDVKLGRLIIQLSRELTALNEALSAAKLAGTDTQGSADEPPQAGAKPRSSRSSSQGKFKELQEKVGRLTTEITEINASIGNIG